MVKKLKLNDLFALVLMINKLFTNEYFYYLSPLFSLFIILVIVFYLRIKIQKIKVLPKDYLKFYAYEKKIKKYFQFPKFYDSALNSFIDFLIKILRRFRIESVKFQVWIEKKLANLKNFQEQKLEQNQQENNLKDDKIS